MARPSFLCIEVRVCAEMSWFGEQTQPKIVQQHSKRDGAVAASVVSAVKELLFQGEKRSRK